MIKKEFLFNGGEGEIFITLQTSTELVFKYMGENYHFRVLKDEGSKIILQDANHQIFHLDYSAHNEGVFLSSKLGEAHLSLKEKKIKSKGGHGEGLISPMPGKIFKILKNEGDQVNKGETILILEAMKMEHPIKSDKDGVIKKIYFKLNEQVSGHVPLALIEAKNG